MSHEESSWLPPSGFERVHDYVWLPRMLAKVRRTVNGAPGEYLCLEASPMDRFALAHWPVDGNTVRAWVAEGLDDQAIAERLAALRGEDEAARRRWSAGFVFLFGVMISAWDAEEGRRAPGLATSLLTGLATGMFAVLGPILRRIRAAQPIG